MTRAVTPKAVYNREGFEMLRTEGKEGFRECEGGMNDEVKGDNGNPRFLVEPLKIVLRPYLDGGRFGKGEVGSRAIEGPMMKLLVRKIGMEGSKLPIRPPVLLSGKSVDKVGSTSGEGALRKFWWND